MNADAILKVVEEEGKSEGTYTSEYSKFLKFLSKTMNSEEFGKLNSNQQQLIADNCFNLSFFNMLKSENKESLLKEIEVIIEKCTVLTDEKISYNELVKMKFVDEICRMRTEDKFSFYFDKLEISLKALRTDDKTDIALISRYMRLLTKTMMVFKSEKYYYDYYDNICGYYEYYVPILLSNLQNEVLESPDEAISISEDILDYIMLVHENGDKYWVGADIRSLSNCKSLYYLHRLIKNLSPNMASSFEVKDGEISKTEFYIMLLQYLINMDQEPNIYRLQNIDAKAIVDELSSKSLDLNLIKKYLGSQKIINFSTIKTLEDIGAISSIKDGKKASEKNSVIFFPHYSNHYVINQEIVNKEFSEIINKHNPGDIIFRLAYNMAEIISNITMISSMLDNNYGVRVVYENPNNTYQEEYSHDYGNTNTDHTITTDGQIDIVSPNVLITDATWVLERTATFTQPYDIRAAISFQLKFISNPFNSGYHKYYDKLDNNSAIGPFKVQTDFHTTDLDIEKIKGIIERYYGIVVKKL